VNEPPVSDRKTALQAWRKELLSQPTPDLLWALQGALLAADDVLNPADRDWALEIAGAFYEYLSDLQSRTSARAFSELASWLDIGAVGTVAMESLLVGEEQVLPRLLVGGLGEALMVWASRQYVRAWGEETAALYHQAAWRLRELWWRWSVRCRPGLSAAERLSLVDSLLAPARDANLPSAARAVLLSHLFQILLWAALEPLERTD